MKQHASSKKFSRWKRQEESEVRISGLRFGTILLKPGRIHWNAKSYLEEENTSFSGLRQTSHVTALSLNTGLIIATLDNTHRTVTPSGCERYTLYSPRLHIGHFHL
jgi:hypothetical protein